MFRARFYGVGGMELDVHGGGFAPLEGLFCSQKGGLIAKFLISVAVWFFLE